MRIDLDSSSGVEGAQGAQIEMRRSGATQRTPNADLGPTEFETSVGKLADSALNFPEVRRERVQTLSTQVEAGTYLVSDQNIAGSVLEQMRVRSY